MSPIIPIIILLVIISIGIELGETSSIGVNAERFSLRYSKKSSGRAIFIKQHLSVFLMVFLISEIIVSNVLGILIVRFADSFDSTLVSFIIQIGIGFLMVVIHITSKIFTVSNMERSMYLVVSAFYWLFWLLLPLGYLGDWIGSKILWLFGVKKHRDVNLFEYRQELISTLNLNKTITSNLEEIEMARHTLSLRDLDIEKIMTHRTDFTTLYFNENIHKFKDSILPLRHTPYIVIKDHHEEILGTINPKDFLCEYLCGNVGDVKQKIIPPRYFVNFTSTYRVLKFFQQNLTSTNNQIAFVVNEFGSLIGLVTLDDIMFEVIGENEDDDIQEFANYLIVDGLTSIRSLNRRMDWAIPDDYLTISAFLIHLHQDIPKPNTLITWNNIGFQILNVARNKILTVKILFTQDPMDKEEERLQSR